MGEFGIKNHDFSKKFSKSDNVDNSELKILLMIYISHSNSASDFDLVSWNPLRFRFSSLSLGPLRISCLIPAVEKSSKRKEMQQSRWMMEKVTRKHRLKWVPCSPPLRISADFIGSSQNSCLAWWQNVKFVFRQCENMPNSVILQRKRAGEGSSCCGRSKPTRRTWSHTQLVPSNLFWPLNFIVWKRESHDSLVFNLKL